MFTKTQLVSLAVLAAACTAQADPIAKRQDESSIDIDTSSLVDQATSALGGSSIDSMYSFR
jgi:hypothetical protein